MATEATDTSAYEVEDVILPGGHRIFEKYEWGGRNVNITTYLKHPVKYVTMCHTLGNWCDTYSTCCTEMQTLQSHQVTVGYKDIVYNFAIGGDGNIYKGRGWDAVVDDTNNIILCYMGYYKIHYLNNHLIEAVNELINYGIILKKISPNYVLLAQNRTNPLQNPGVNVYNEIKKWKHFKSELVIK